MNLKYILKKIPLFVPFIFLTLACGKQNTKIPASTYTSSLFAGNANYTGNTNATGTSASFNYPRGITVDTNSNLYVADFYNHAIRKIDTNGVVTTYAGSTSGLSGTTDNSGTSALFTNPSAITIDSSNNLYVADTGNYKIRKIDTTSLVSTYAGTGVLGSDNNTTATSATFNSPSGIVADTSGNLYVSDTGNFLIRKIASTAPNAVTTYAGTSTVSGYTNATSTLARFFNTFGLAVNASGNVFVADYGNNSIRKISPSQVVTTFAGNGPTYAGFVDDYGFYAYFNNPYGITADTSGNLYVTDANNNAIRKITPEGIVTTLEIINSSLISYPYGIAYDKNTSNLYVTTSTAIIKITPLN